LDARRQRLDDRSLRQRFGLAVLQESGALGYRNATVEGILRRAGGSRTLFYRLYTGREECFALAYADATGALADRLTAVCAAAGGWRRGIADTLAELATFIESDPEAANGVLVQVRAAEGDAAEQRAAFVARLVAAVDAARDDREAQPGIPPVAASFLVHAIEEVAARALQHEASGDFRAAIPGLVYLAVVTYFSVDAARAEYQRLLGDDTTL
jgi:AcrR family transcriptional regulator